MFPPRVEDYPPEGHLARFVAEIVERLDLGSPAAAYSDRDSMQYHPSMMVALLFYGYAAGTFSSRKLEQATYYSIAYRYICSDTNPDHDSINSFRKRFLEEPGGLFEQILVMAHAMGVLKMGTVSLDGTKIKANASMEKELDMEAGAQGREAHTQGGKGAYASGGGGRQREARRHRRSQGVGESPQAS